VRSNEILGMMLLTWNNLSLLSEPYGRHSRAQEFEAFCAGTQERWARGDIAPLG
jgi:queuine tRNA-ribosyltransferase